MPRLEEYDKVFITMASTWAELSKDKRKKNAAIIVKDHRIISCGYNGMPSGMDNTCQNKEGKTKPEVIHAEANAILWLAREGGGSKGATIYTTTSPCVECTKCILQAGIVRVVYLSQYSDTMGIELLKEVGVEVVEIPKRNLLE